MEVYITIAEEDADKYGLAESGARVFLYNLLHHLYGSELQFKHEGSTIEVYGQDSVIHITIEGTVQ